MRNIRYKNDNSAYLDFLIMSLIHIFYFILLPEHNSATVRNILKVFGRLIELANAGCPMQDSELWLSLLSNYVP